MSFTPYYLFFDFDDTLFLHYKVHNRTKRALKRAQKAGCKLYMNSGRSLGNLIPDLKRTMPDITFEGYICGFNNAYVGNNAEERVISYSIPFEQVEKYIDYCVKYSYWAPIEIEEDLPYVLEIHGDVKYTDEEYAEFRRKALEYLKDKTVVKFNCCPPKSANYIAINLKEENPEVDFIKGTTYYESCKQGYGKGVILKEFAELCNLDFDRCIHFGDSINDKNGFEVAKISVGMKKTPKEIQHLCTYVAETDFGVAEYINKVLLKQIKKEKKALKNNEK